MFKQSEAIDQISTALSAFQGEVENATKGSDNPFFKSKYADLAEVLNTIRPLMGKNGLALTQSPYFEGNAEGGIVGVETVLVHQSGQWFSSSLTAPVFPTVSERSGKVQPVSAQTVGSAITYCRRYAAAAMLGIAQEDDDGQAQSGHNAADKGKAQQQPPPPPPPSAAVWAPKDTEELQALLDKVGNHLRVQNKLDELEDFTAKVIKSKTTYSAAAMLPQLRTREKEFAAQATAYIQTVVGAPTPEGQLPIDQVL